MDHKVKLTNFNASFCERVRNSDPCGIGKHKKASLMLLLHHCGMPITCPSIRSSVLHSSRTMQYFSLIDRLRDLIKTFKEVVSNLVTNSTDSKIENGTIWELNFDMTLFLSSTLHLGKKV